MPASELINYAQAKPNSAVEFAWKARSERKDKGARNYSGVILRIPGLDAPIREFGISEFIAEENRVDSSGQSVLKADGTPIVDKHSIHSESKAILAALLEAKKRVIEKDIKGPIPDILRNFNLSEYENLASNDTARPEALYNALIGMKVIFNNGGASVDLFTERRSCTNNPGYEGGCAGFLNALLPGKQHKISHAFDDQYIDSEQFKKNISEVYTEVEKLKKEVSLNASASKLDASASSSAAAAAATAPSKTFFPEEDDITASQFDRLVNPTNAAAAAASSASGSSGPHKSFLTEEDERMWDDLSASQLDRLGNPLAHSSATTGVGSSTITKTTEQKESDSEDEHEEVDSELQESSAEASAVTGQKRKGKLLDKALDKLKEGAKYALDKFGRKNSDGERTEIVPNQEASPRSKSSKDAVMGSSSVSSGDEEDSPRSVSADLLSRALSVAKASKQGQAEFPANSPSASSNSSVAASSLNSGLQTHRDKENEKYKADQATQSALADKKAKEELAKQLASSAAQPSSHTKPGNK